MGSAHSRSPPEALSGRHPPRCSARGPRLDPLDWYASAFTVAAAGSTHLTLPFGLRQ